MSDVDELKTGGGTGNEGDEPGGKTDPGSGGGNPDGGDKTDPSRVAFTPQQQKTVQGLIDDAYRRAFAKVSRGAISTEEHEKLQAELKALQDKAAGKDDINEAVQQAVEELNTKHKLEMEGVATKLAGMTDDKKRAMILSVVSRHGVMDAAEITTLVWNDVAVAEDGSLTVKGEGDAPKLDLNDGGRPMTLDTYIKAWLAERPHHMRAAQPQGAGSRGAIGTGNGKAKTMLRAEFDKLPPVEQKKVALSTEIKVVDG